MRAALTRRAGRGYAAPMPGSERVITVMGATGYTGRLIAAQLRRRGVPFAIAARAAGKLEELSASLGGADTLVADIGDRASLARLAERSRVLINCAGPFTDLGEPVVLAAIQHGAHYLDTTGEQPFIKTMRAHDPAAKERGVAVVPAMAFEVALSDCAAAVAGDGFREIQAIQVTYAVALKASQGTQRTAARMLAGPGYAYRGGEWVEEPPARRRVTVDFPPPIGRVAAVSFPSAEIMTIPMHQRVREVQVFMQAPAVLARILVAAAPVLPVVLRGAGALASRLVGEGTGGPDEPARAATRFHIAVDVRGLREGRATRRRVLLSGADPYGLTAVIAVRAAEWMCRDDFHASGVLPPAGAVPPRDFLDSLQADGVTYTITEG